MEDDFVLYAVKQFYEATEKLGDAAYSSEDIQRIFKTKYSRMDKVKFCGRQPLKNLRGYGLL